jgi:mono/diheme cytochrome c family protein
MNPKVGRVLKVFGWILGVVVALVFVVLIYAQMRWDRKYDRKITAFTTPRDSATIARGEYIFKFQAQCWNCHAGGTLDANSSPSGGKMFDLANTGPGFGTWYGPNITPDNETGIGGWSDGEIVRAIREGLRKDGRTLFSMMPADWYYGISDGDALALVAYLRSIPPVSNRVSPPRPSIFAKALFSFGVIKPKDAITTVISAPAPGPTAAYGEYLASRLAGCNDCHTPRDLKNGAVFLDSLGAGGTIAFGEAEGDPVVSFASNITPDSASGIGNWDETQFFAAVTVGMTPAGAALDPHMPYAYFKSFTKDDLRAIFLYLKGLPPIKRSTSPWHYSAPVIGSHGIDRGRFLFQGRCQYCHGPNGIGAQPTQVKLAEAAAAFSDKDLKDFVKAGDANQKMPAFRKTLSEDELGDLVAFIRSLEKK